MMTKLKPILDFLFPPTGLDRTIAALTAKQLLSRSALFEKDNVLAFFRYDDELIKRMVWKLKYRGDAAIAALFAESVYDVLVEELSDHALFRGFAQPLLVPIPLGKKRLRERGYNQAEIFAHAIETQNHILSTTEAHLLLKIRETAPQTTLPKKARETNILRAFAVSRPQEVNGKSILLIDDVTTTGSTFREARKVLEEAGARCVVCLAIAH